VTLAVGMAYIFSRAAGHFAAAGEGLWKYWYHFAIMFEALFILTTIDAGTRIGRFLVQEIAGKIHPKLGRQNWIWGAMVSSGLIVGGWAYFMSSGSFAVIWGMFGVANQMLAVIALAVVSAVLVGEGRGRYLWVTAGPMMVVATTTTTAAMELLMRHWTTFSAQWANGPGIRDVNVMTNAALSGGLIVAMLGCTGIIVGAAAVKCVPALFGMGDENIASVAARLDRRGQV
jgi:carbon starvation protein